METDDNGNIIQIDYEGGSVKVPFDQTINVHYLDEHLSDLENLLDILIKGV